MNVGAPVPRKEARAKLTGAGGGGAAIGLARDAAHADALVRAAEQEGMRAFAEEISP